VITRPPTRRTGYVTDPALLAHRSVTDLGAWTAPGGDLDTQGPRRRLAALIHDSGLADVLVPLAPATLTWTDLLRVHTPAYLIRLQDLSAGAGGEAGELAGVAPGAYETAVLSAGACYEAVRTTLTGEVETAYALARPPGHHAERERGMGYCLLANIAIAVRKARAELGLGRVAVVDWDVHHGNGTQQAFWDDPEVLAVSLHQDGYYPDASGGVEETGGPGAQGTTLNVPLPAGSGIGAYEHALAEVVLPALEAHGAQLVVVACGFDAGGLDPLGRMLLSSSAFAAMTGTLLDHAAGSGAALVLCQEGGYSAVHVPFCGVRALERLSGAATDVTDPFDWLDDLPGQPLAPHQREAVAAALAAHAQNGGGPRSAG
jgi:acetoin utilization deacetylase AcuC-like enzyme